MACKNTKMMQLFSPNEYSIKPSQVIIRLIGLLLLMLVGNIVFIGISAFISYIVWGYNFFANPAFLTVLSNPDMLPIVKLFQALQTVGLFLFPGIVWAWFYTKPIKKSFMLGKFIRAEMVLFLFLLVLVAVPMINWLAELNGQIVFPDGLKSLEYSFRSNEARAESFMFALLKTDSVFVLFVNLFVVAVLPAVAEEVFFRGVLQNEIERSMRHSVWAVLITAFIFSAFHFQFFTFLPRFILGIILGLVYVWSRNLWMPIVFHFFNNAMTVIAWFWFSPEIINENIDTLGTYNNMWMLALLSTLVVSLFLYYVRYYFRKQCRS